MKQSNRLSTILKQYKNFILEALDVIKNLEISFEDKVLIVQQIYAPLHNPDIEKNELLLNALKDFKKSLLDSLDKNLVSKYVEMISVIEHLEIISFDDFIDLIDFRDTIRTLSQSRQLATSSSFKKNSMQRNEIRYKDIDFKNVDIPKELQNYIESNVETRDTLERKEEVLRIFDQMFQRINFDLFHPGCQVTYSFYGSYVNQTSLPGSDIDISLDVTPECDKVKFLEFLLGQISPMINEYDCEIDAKLLKKANPPFFDVIFKEWGNISLSFAVNNKLAVINSRMLALYMSLDKRCRILCLLIKLWANAHQIISARKFFLSCYAYNLMVINFLQTIKPPILPSLKRLRREDLSAEAEYVKINGERIRVDFEDNKEKLEEIMKLKYSQNKMNIIELLFQFFELYGRDISNFESITLSIKEGERLKRDMSNMQVNFLYSIEDPFDKVKNAGRQVSNELKSSANPGKIRNAMRGSRALLKKGEYLKIFRK